MSASWYRIIFDYSTKIQRFNALDSMAQKYPNFIIKNYYIMPFYDEYKRSMPKLWNVRFFKSHI